MHNNYAKATIKKQRFIGKADSLTQKYFREWDDPRIGVRSAWYVNWDKHAYISLKNNIKHLNMVLPEWFLSILRPTRWSIGLISKHCG